MSGEARRLAGKVVAVTGGARGIGRATAATLIGEGATVAIGDLDRELCERVAGELGAGCVGFELDVADPDSFAGFLEEVEARLGPLDALVNNAGIMKLSTFVDEDDAASDRMIDVNLRGVITGTRLALRRMLPRNAGHIVNVASSAGKTGVPGAATYSATKHAVVGFSEAVRGELRGTGIELSCVMPGIVRTELAAGVPEGRGVKAVQAVDVARAIVATLRRPRFDVFVPASAGVFTRLMAALPRGARDSVAHALKADEVLWKVVDRGARASYEQRASVTEPDGGARESVGATEAGNR